VSPDLIIATYNDRTRTVIIVTTITIKDSSLCFLSLFHLGISSHYLITHSLRVLPSTSALSVVMPRKGVRNFHAASRVYALRERSRCGIMPRLDFLFISPSSILSVHPENGVIYDVWHFENKHEGKMQRGARDRPWRD